MTWTRGSASRTAVAMTRLHESMARIHASRAAVGVRRFTRAETWVHRSLNWLMGVCVFTAACLYVPQLAEIVGRRRLVVTLHEWSGIMLPVPIVLGLLSRAFRADAGRLGRFFPHDWRWLRIAARHRRRETGLAGKFNAGQKLFAAFVVGTVLVMIGTGLLMWFPRLSPLVWRTGATFVHDWLALLVAVVITGHVWLATKDPEARRGLRTGHVPRWWIREEHPLWQAEPVEPAAAAGSVESAEAAAQAAPTAPSAPAESAVRARPVAPAESGDLPPAHRK
jgi:formate dehydrogenase subunit gamma